MNLTDVLDKISELSDEEVIFARKPWRPESEVVVGELDSTYRPPRSIVERGFDYFMEVSTVNEVLEVLATRSATPQERCRLVLYYAENDAFPDWVYEDDRSCDS